MSWSVRVFLAGLAVIGVLFVEASSVAAGGGGEDFGENWNSEGFNIDEELNEESVCEMHQYDSTEPSSYLVVPGCNEEWEEWEIRGELCVTNAHTSEMWDEGYMPDELHHWSPNQCGGSS